MQPGDGVVIFASPGAGAASARALVAEIGAYGGRIVVVAHGETDPALETPPADGDEEWLSPLLDVIPTQLFIRALATKGGVPPGFRQITKVTTQL